MPPSNWLVSVVTETILDSTAFYRCPEDLTFEDGNQYKTITCMANGFWNENNFTCGGEKILLSVVTSIIKMCCLPVCNILSCPDAKVLLNNIHIKRKSNEIFI